jgi:hypothetical protein
VLEQLQGSSAEFKGVQEGDRARAGGHALALGGGGCSASREYYEVSASVAVSSGFVCKPRIAGFFCKKTVNKKDLLRKFTAYEHVAQAKKEVEGAVEGIDPHKEAQELMNRLRGSGYFEVDVEAQPTFKIFSEAWLSAPQRNVRILLLSGHAQLHCGFLWLKARLDEASATEYEEIDPDRFVNLFSPIAKKAGARGTIECVVLNACKTEEIGNKLRTAGVPHVVCWRSKVNDTTATDFAVNFFTVLDQSGKTEGIRDYKLAFHQAAARISKSDPLNRGIFNPILGPKEKHLATGAVDVVCLLSQAGDEFPGTGYIRNREVAT